MSVQLAVGEGGACRLAGELDFAAAGELHARTGELLGSAAEVTLDLADVSAVSSAGLALLLEWQRQAHRRGVRLRITGLPEQARRLARLSEVEGLVEAGAAAEDVRQRDGVSLR